jgi:phosphatidylserine/phosphatidylglycerophosphate/cardiolipin synthase-like enzyme
MKTTRHSLRAAIPLIFSFLLALPAQAVDLFQNNEAALLAREQSLIKAKPSDEISLLTFTFREGRSASRLISLIAKAARDRQGVEGAAPVRMLVDGHFANGKLFPEAMAQLAWAQTQGVEVRVFNPIEGANFLNAPWINHRKIFVVGETVIFGGRNTAPHYLESTKEHPGFVDLDLRINPGENPPLAYEFGTLGGAQNDIFKGYPLRKKFKKLFEEMWESDSAEELTAKNLALAAKVKPIDVKVVAAPAPCVELKGARGWELFRSEWDPNFDDFARSLQIAIEQEPDDGEIYFESPYFMPSKEILAELGRALKRGVKFTLVTNTFKTANGASKAISVFMDKYYRELTEKGATFLFTQKRMLHAKLFVFKKTGLTYLGSHNAHRRSGKFDLETMAAWREPGDASMVAIRSEFWTKGEGKGELGAYRPVAEDMIDVMLDAQKAAVDEEGNPVEPTRLQKILDKVLGYVVSAKDVATPEGRAAIREKIESAVKWISWIFEDPVGAFL